MDRRRFLGLSAAATLATVVRPRIGFAATAAIRPAFSSLTLEPRSHYSVGTIGEVALIAGGHTSNPDGTIPPAQLAAIDWVDLYDAGTNVWGTAKLSEPRIEPTIASAGPVGIVVGGSRGRDASPALDIFDSTNRAWTRLPLSEPRKRPVTVTAGSTILIADGAGDDASRTVELFDSVRGTLVTREPQVSSEFLGWSLSSGGSMAFLVEISNGPVNEVHRYDAGSGEFDRIQLSEPRERPLVRVRGDRAFVVSGQGTGVSTMDAIDLASGEVRAWPLPRPDARLIDVRGDQGSRLLLRAPASGEPRDIDESQFDLFDAASDRWTSLLLTHPRLGVQVAAHLGWYFFIGGSTRPGGPPSGMYDIYRTKTGEMGGGSLHDPCFDYSIAIAGKRVVITGGMCQDFGRAPRPGRNGDIIEVEGGSWSGGLSVARENALVTTAGPKALFVGGDTHPEGGVHEPQAPIVDIFDSTAW